MKARNTVELQELVWFIIYQRFECSFKDIWEQLKLRLDVERDFDFGKSVYFSDSNYFSNSQTCNSFLYTKINPDTENIGSNNDFEEIDNSLFSHDTHQKKLGIEITKRTLQEVLDTLFSHGLISIYKSNEGFTYIKYRALN